MNENEGSNDRQPKAMHVRALAIQEAEFGREHSNVAFTLTCLGDTCRELGDGAAARDLVSRSGFGPGIHFEHFRRFLETN